MTLLSRWSLVISPPYWSCQGKSLRFFCFFVVVFSGTLTKIISDLCLFLILERPVSGLAGKVVCPWPFLTQVAVSLWALNTKPQILLTTSSATKYSIDLSAVELWHDLIMVVIVKFCRSWEIKLIAKDNCCVMMLRFIIVAESYSLCVIRNHHCRHSIIMISLTHRNGIQASCWRYRWAIYPLHVGPVDIYPYNIYRADSRLAPSQWETSLQSNAVSHWLGTNLESALIYYPKLCHHHACKYPRPKNARLSADTSMETKLGCVLQN